MAVTVLIVDNSSIFRHRIIEVLSRDPRLRVVGTMTDDRDAVEQAVDGDRLEPGPLLAGGER